MYMGFMKMGLSLMGLFAVTLAIAGTLDLGAVLLLSVVIWFYGFFHAHNLAGLEEDKFRAVEDDYLFHMSSFSRGKEFISFYRKAVAAVLIFLGAVMLWDVICRFTLDYVQLPDELNSVISGMNDVLPRIIISVAIIILGVHMIKGKKKDVEKDSYFSTENMVSETDAAVM